MDSKDSSTCTTQPIDWMDLKFSFLLGSLYLLSLLVVAARPEWHITRPIGLDVILPFGYIIWRARRQPEKLDEWGITTRLTKPAVATAVLLLCIVVLYIAAWGTMLAGRVPFEPSYVPAMFDYVLGAFPQQFVMCSVGLVFLGKLRPFRGVWRLAITVGLVFSLAHVCANAAAHKPELFLPMEHVFLFIAGFSCAFYFLKFRNMLPLTAIHAIAYPLLHHWVNVHQ